MSRGLGDVYKRQELNMALEDACGVSIPDEELAKLKTVGDIYNYIIAHV